MMRILVLLSLTFFCLAGCNLEVADDPSSAVTDNLGYSTVMTPYTQWRAPGEYYAGATFDLSATGRSLTRIADELQLMKSLNINTITVYGLENESEYMLDNLFSMLRNLGMKIVVRIEAYDSRTFRFSQSDAHTVFNHYKDLIDYVSDSSRRGQVAYFALNMPVDDGNVTSKFGGQTDEWRTAQVTYATELVRLMREHLEDVGFGSASLYLSVHYGWDNTYELLSYEPAGADGYFINCYSYPYLHGGPRPEDKHIPTVDDPVETLIDVDQIDKCMSLYMSQYQREDGSYAPLVMEFGFHTMEANGGNPTAQTAGLVFDKAAKEKAMQGTISYYDSEYPFVEGAMYFGYNQYKREGEDNAMMDWTLVY